jgi:hypothetical protein
MHFNFDFSARQVIWTLTFASQLVLLVVLLGRDRARRFPVFTAGIAIYALQLMAQVLLSTRMPMLSLQEIFIPVGILMVVIGILVLVEVARNTFAGLKPSLWIANTIGLLVVAGGIMAFWGPWPHLNEIGWTTVLDKLRLSSLVAQKGDLLVNLLGVELGLTVLIFGRRFKAGWRHHAQIIMIGLSTAALASIAVQATWQIIAHSVHPTSREEYQHIMSLGNKLMTGNSVVYLVVLVWWIVCLWLDEPKAATVEAVPATPAE